jgi:hypothetical protein
MILGLTKLINQMNLKLLISPIIGAALLMSCGGGNQEAEKKAEPEKPKCTCSEMIEIQGKWKAKGELYTGLCEDLDETNTVVNKGEFVNGIKIFNWTAKKFGGKYVTIDSVYIGNGKYQEGFFMGTYTQSGCVYVNEYATYSGGNRSSNSISIYSDRMVFYDKDKNQTILNDDTSQDPKTFLINGMKKANEIDSHFKILEMN